MLEPIPPTITLVPLAALLPNFVLPVDSVKYVSKSNWARALPVESTTALAKLSDSGSDSVLARVEGAGTATGAAEVFITSFTTSEKDTWAGATTGEEFEEDIFYIYYIFIKNFLKLVRILYIRTLFNYKMIHF
jgi:hypothetical protein